MIDDEEKNRRMRKAGRKKPYSIRAAVASSASARPTSQNGARTQVQNALSQHRQRHTLPPSPVSVPASIEEDLSSEECDYFFIPLPTTTAAPATVERQKPDDEQRRRHILRIRIRSRLLENQGTHAPEQISTVLTLPHEPVDLNWARLLMPPQRPSYDSQTRHRRLKPRTVSAPGGFLNDVHWAAVDLEEEERRRAEEVLEYDRPVRNFVRVLSLLRAVLDVDPHTSAPISNTIRPGSPTTTTTTIPSRLIVMEGHAKADVIELLHLMLDLHAESERLRWKQGEQEPTSREVEVVLDVLLRERAVHEQEQEQEQELVFRPTVLLGDGVQDDQGFGSPSLQMQQDGDQAEEAEVESLLGLTRPPRSSGGTSLSLSSTSGSGSDLEMHIDMEMGSQDGEDRDDEDGRWLYDSRTLISDQQ
ncbi:unnamed protein product [Tilletia caries]|nr:unnamed protein product [Tilletia caries]